MRVRIQVVIESDDGPVQDGQGVFQLHRGDLKPERLGLTLEEAKEPWKGCSASSRPGKWKSTWMRSGAVRPAAGNGCRRGGMRSCTARCSAG